MSTAAGSGAANFVRFVTVWLGIPPRWRTTSKALARVIQARRQVKATELLSAELSYSTGVMVPSGILGHGGHFWLAFFLAGRRTCVLGAGAFFFPASMLARRASIRLTT